MSQCLWVLLFFVGLLYCVVRFKCSCGYIQDSCCVKNRYAIVLKKLALFQCHISHFQLFSWKFSPNDNSSSIFFKSVFQSADQECLLAEIEKDKLWILRFILHPANSSLNKNFSTERSIYFVPSSEEGHEMWLTATETPNKCTFAENFLSHDRLCMHLDIFRNLHW